jgi:hypothetical protein
MSQTILIQSLENVRRRVRWMAVLFGSGLVAACFVGLLISVVLADYILNLPALPRLILILGALGTGCYATWYWIIRSLFSRLELKDIAGRIEQAFPEYQDRLRSTIDILGGKELPGSEVMKQRVVSETARLTQSLDLTRVVVTGPVLYTTTAGLSALLLLSLLMGTLQRDYLSAAANRLLTPFASTPWPKQVIIDSIGNLPDRLPVGQRLDVNIRLSRGQSASRKAIIYYQYGDETGKTFGPVEQELMTRGNDGTYHASIDARTAAGAATGTLKVWMESGDDRMDLKPIRIVQRLAIAKVEAVITAPPYAKQPAIRVNMSQNPAAMTAGSTVQLTAFFSKPLDTAKPVTVDLLTPASKPVFDWQPASSNQIIAAVDATESFRFRLHATDTDGFTNTAAEEFEFVVKPDKLPAAYIETPHGNEEHTAESNVPLQILAEDDFGIQALTLAVDRLGDKKHWEIPLVQNSVAVAGTQWVPADSTTDLQRFRANHAWELSQLPDSELHAGDVLEYYALVKDNYDFNGATHPPVASAKLRITIISQEELVTKAMDELTAAAEQAKALHQSQETTRHETSELAKAIASKPEMDNADRATAERLAAQQSTIAAQTKSLGQTLAQLKDRLEQNKSTNQEVVDTAKEVSDLLNHAAENSMKNAAGNLDNARNPADKTDRDRQLSNAQDNQSTAAEALQKSLDRMGNVGSLSRSLESMQHLLAQQQKLTADTTEAGKKNVGKSRDQFSPEDRKKLDDLSKQQAALAAQTAKMQKDLARDAAKLAKSDPTAAAAMSKAADSAKMQNVAGNQNKASKATEQNQQSQAQAAQQQAQQGMQQMLDDLQEAQQQKIQQLAQKLADVQQQVAALVREQASHNLDNLNLQGRDALAGMDAAERAALFTSAELDPAVPLPATEIGTLSSLQEQTEHNAREVIKAIADLPKMEETADHLTDAAGNMERAIINLHDGKLADAYNPAQVEALASLLLVKKSVDAQKDAVDQQQEDQKKQTVRAAYVAILAQQSELNRQTIEIDSSPKNEDGVLSRAAALQLSQLAFQQGKLADKAADLDADLATLGSIVYSYANRDIVKSMTDVKTQLGQQSTGAATQAGQQQIVSAIQAMIRDLAIKPLEDKFAEEPKKSSSSGGVDGPPPPPTMPGEAEFRLMKDLQLALNDATIAASRQPQPDKLAIVALGKRQAELRALLDQLLQKSSKGKVKLPPEPDIHDPLPEESAKAVEKVDDQELDNDLLGGSKVAKKDGKPAAAPTGPGGVIMIGDRMARARQRLEISNDPGPITQEIQSRIIDNLNGLIEASRKKQPKPSPPKPPKPTTQPKSQSQSKPKPDAGIQPQNSEPKPQQKMVRKGDTPGDKPEGDSADKPAAGSDVNKQEARMWGDTPPRDRDAVLESQSEKVLEKYKNLVDDYYRTMSTKSGDQ